MDKEKKVLEECALEKEAALQRKIKTIGNYVHDSVPTNNNEAWQSVRRLRLFYV